VPFFTFETSEGWAPLTKDWFMGRCNEIRKAAGYEELLQHGFWIGGATDLLLRGTPPDIIMVQGRWASHCLFVLYWRKIEDILPLFLSCTFIIDHMTQLTNSMKDFCSKYSQ